MAQKYIVRADRAYVKPGFCKWCGSPIIKGRKAYCCNECRDAFRKKTVWGRTRDAYSLRILYRDNFTCQDCGEFHAYKKQTRHFSADRRWAVTRASYRSGSI